jgi:hypothetical protein
MKAKSNKYNETLSMQETMAITMQTMHVLMAKERDPEKNVATWSDLSDGQKAYWFTLADAALTVLEEPTGAMVLEVLEAMKKPVAVSSKSWDEQRVSDYCRYNAAALKGARKR